MPVTTVRLGGRPDQPLLLLGPAAGTSVQALWGTAARELARDFQVVGWDLPGHGTNVRFLEEPDETTSRLTVESLTRDVLDAIDRLLDTAPGVAATPVHYAGHGIGGVVGLLLARGYPRRVASLSLVGCCLAPTADTLVPDPRAPGLPPGLVADHPRTAEALLAAAGRTRTEAVTAVRRAHALVDLRDHLADVVHPVLAVHGAEDPRCDAESVSAVLDGLGGDPTASRVEVLDGIADLVAAEAPTRVAELLREHALGRRPGHGDEVGRPGEKPLDARTEALVRVAVAAATPGSVGESGVRAVLDACRAASRAGATSAAVERTLALAWGAEDADGRLSRKLGRMLEAAR